jgi:hypothetical protein
MRAALQCTAQTLRHGLQRPAYTNRVGHVQSAEMSKGWPWGRGEMAIGIRTFNLIGIHSVILFW